MYDDDCLNLYPVGNPCSADRGGWWLFLQIQKESGLWESSHLLSLCWMPYEGSTSDTDSLLVLSHCTEYTEIALELRQLVHQLISWLTENSATILIDLFIFSSKSTKHCLVSASQMWSFLISSYGDATSASGKLQQAFFTILYTKWSKAILWENNQQMNW